MFEAIHKRLTVSYSILLAIFLLSFVGTTYFAVTWLVYSQEKEDLRWYAEEEAREHTSVLRDHYRGQAAPAEPAIDDAGKTFYYVLDNEGNEVVSATARPALQDIVREQLHRNNLKWGDVSQFTVTPEGQKKTLLLLTVAPIRENDTILGSIYVGRDITSYQRLLRKLFTVLIGVSLFFLLLIALIGHFMARKAMVPIQHSFEQQRKFAADASHELRTPLSVLLTSVDAAQRDDDSRFSPFVEQLLVDMKDEIRKMSTIVSDLLLLARADAEAILLRKEQADLQPLAEQIIRTLRPLATAKHITLHLSCPANLPIYADRERLSQLFLILLDNGIKYTQEGGNVSLTILSSPTSDSHYEITVKDNGMGIAPEDQVAIFRRFYRVDKARSRNQGGSGLGLSIAKWIVDAHEGTISVDSQLTKGSIFIVILPK